MTTDFIGSLVLGGLDFFTRRYFAFEKKFYRPYLGYISAVLSPIGSNFGQRSAWLASWIAILWKNLVTY